MDGRPGCMIRCNNCGTANLDGSEYCDECGMKLDMDFRPVSPARDRIDPPVYQPPSGIGVDVAGPGLAAGSGGSEMRVSSRGTLDGQTDGPSSRTSEGPIPVPPSFTTSTTIPKPVKPLSRRPTESRPVEPAREIHQIEQELRAPELAHPGNTKVLSSRGRTDALRSDQPGSQASGNGRLSSKLVIERGGRVGKEFPITAGETQIGRWDADSGIFPDVDLDQDDPEAKVSRRHARIINQNGQFYIEDLGSTNGTFINRGRRLLPGHRQMLQSGDEIIVGKTFLKFQILR
jgi:hypothetical protein